MAPTLTRLLHDTGFVRVVARVGQDSHSAAITHSSLSALTSSFLTHTHTHSIFSVMAVICYCVLRASEDHHWSEEHPWCTNRENRET